MDEIAGKLTDLLEVLKAQQPQGLVPQERKTVSGMLELYCSPAWFGFTIYNDGPDPVYADTNRLLPINPHTPNISPGENLIVRMQTAAIQRLYLQTLTGQTANVRIWAII